MEELVQQFVEVLLGRQLLCGHHQRMEGLRPSFERHFCIGRSFELAFCRAPFCVKGLDHPQDKPKQGKENQNGQQRQFPKKRPDGSKKIVLIYVNQEAPSRTRVSMSDGDLRIGGDDGSTAATIRFFDEAAFLETYKGR